jgi:serine/threonine protein kinase
VLPNPSAKACAMQRPSDFPITAPSAGLITCVADKATIPPAQSLWFSRIKEKATVRDPSATVSYIVARDGETAPDLGVAAESLQKVRQDFTPGTLLQERYRLVRELGRGGMGIVFLGRDLRLDRNVALKVILGTGSSASVSATMDSRLRSSFAEEARLGASLTHPAIATVFDYGFHHDNPFTVFEYIEGQTLRDLIERRGRLPLDEVRLIVGPLAQALDFAHGRRIVHRDLKPENIRATEQRQFKILDLGLAREFNRQEDWCFAGTPAYAAPEQAAELPSDGRADQYALGVIVFELLTGRRPFESDSWIDLLEKHYSEPPPRPRSLVAELPQSVEEAILRSLEKDPNRRFSSCSELAVALGCQFLAGPAPLPEILLETEVKKMGGRWKTYFYPLSFRHPRTYLALAPEALWGMYRSELMRWPYDALEDLKTTFFRKLSFRIRGVAGKNRQWFKFKSPNELRAWHEFLAERVSVERETPGAASRASSSVDANGGGSDVKRAASGSAPDPGLEPVVLLKGRPGTRFQLLGMVEAKSPNRPRAAAGLAIRGSMMGADAVVNLEQERLPGLARTEYRAGGMAVRAVDDDGRLELKTRWFSAQIGQISLVMLIWAFIESCGTLATLLNPFTLHTTTRTLNVVTSLALLALTGSLAYLKWPQLARPTALCFLAKVPATILGMIGSLLSSWLASMSAGVPPLLAVPVMSIFGLGSLASVSLLIFFFYVGRRAWRIDQEYRSLASRVESKKARSSSRKWLGGLALAGAISYALTVNGVLAVADYAALLAVVKSPKTYAEVSAPGGPIIRGNPREWNTTAWKLATDADPSERNPGEAVRLAGQAVAADPSTDNYNTLGVARYRAGDFAGAIEALSHGAPTREPTAYDAFFLAMASARLGRQAEAKNWYDKADGLMRRSEPENAELRRFREEASVVLEISRHPNSSTAPPPGAKTGVPRGAETEK